MIIWSTSAALFVMCLVIALIAAIIAVERKRVNDGILVSSHYSKLFIAGAAITALGIIVMVIFKLVDVPALIGLPIATMGLGYLSAGYVYRREWLRWVHSYAELERKYIITDRG